MPAPFIAGSNLADEQAVPVHYRFPADASIGYLQLFATPWQHDRVVLAVLGSTTQAVADAGATITTSELREQLSGNLAIIQNNQIVVGGKAITIDENRLQPTTTLTSSLTTATTGTVPTPAPITIPPATLPQQPSWILPAMIGSSSLMGLIVIGALISSLRGRRRSG